MYRQGKGFFLFTSFWSRNSIFLNYFLQKLVYFQGGQASGTCAEGFGVCCVFVMECGSTYSQNVSQIENSRLKGLVIYCDLKFQTCLQTSIVNMTLRTTDVTVRTEQLLSLPRGVQWTDPLTTWHLEQLSLSSRGVQLTDPLTTRHLEQLSL